MADKFVLMIPCVPLPEPALPARGNRLDQVGDKKRVLRIWQTARVGPTTRRLEFMQFGADELRPVVFLHSIEYPNCPGWGFCVDAAQAGFGIFAVRRPGFGNSDRVNGAEEQAVLIGHFLEEAGLENAILVSVGSACPVGYRVALASLRVTYSVFVNCVFNRDVMAEFRPQWLGPIFAQAVQNPAGARVSLTALRRIAGQFGAKWFYETCGQKSPGDVEFVSAYVDDIEAAWQIGSAIQSDTFRDEMRYSLNDDPLLTDGVLSRVRGIALSGAETTETWRSGFEAEAKRVGIPYGYLPSGDLFAAYQSGNMLLDLLRECA